MCRYTKDLPAGVTRMNDECLKLKDHTAGYQTVEDIQRVVTEAIGASKALMNERLIDEVMVSCVPQSTRAVFTNDMHALIAVCWFLCVCVRQVLRFTISGFECSIACCARMTTSITDHLNGDFGAFPPASVLSLRRVRQRPHQRYT